MRCLQQAFMEKYKKEIEHFGMLSDYNDSQEYMRENPHLACEDTANYLALWCINLEVQEVCSLNSLVWHWPQEIDHNYSYSQYWTGTSMQWRLIRGNIFKKS